ncbi:MAG TPA: M1 family aminopeptidase [Dictyoglomaceae bacterium]|nr:M1 family aminopeptidase [Dictyoglomaceae bacterium]
MKKIVFLLLTVSLLITFSYAEVSSTYKIYAQLSPNEKIIGGKVEVEYINNTSSELSEIYFYLPANLLREKNPYLHDVLEDSQYVNGFDPGFTKVEKVVDENNNPISYSLEEGKILSSNYSLKDNYLKVKLPYKILPSESFKLTIYFRTKFPSTYLGDMSYAKDAFVWRFGWFPYELPYINGEWDKGGRLLSSNFYLELMVPSNFTVALGMDVVKEEVTGEWKKIIGENTSPRRSVPIALSRIYRVYKLSDSTEPEIYVYYYPGREYKARLLASYAREAISYYSNLYGSSGHKRINIVEGQITGLWGMTADGLVILGNSIFYSSDLISPFLLERINEWLLSHEIAHLWWGIGIGVDFDRENWISESFAQYLSITYFERKYGGKGANLFPDLGDDYFVNFLKDSLMGNMNLRETQVELPYLYYLKDGWDEEVVKEYWESYANGYSNKIYNKSYLAIRALASELGEENFDKYLSDIFNDFKGKIVTTDDIKDSLEKYAGKDLEAFFKSWFYSKGKVDFEINKVISYYKGGKWENQIYIKNNGEIIIPVEVKIIYENNQEEKIIYNGMENPLKVESYSPVKTVVLDPDSKIPDADRVNNWYPRKIIYTPKREIPLDAYVFYYDILPSFSFDLFTGEISTASYHVEFYDPLNFLVMLEGFYQGDYQGLNFAFLYSLPKEDSLLFQLIWLDPDIYVGKISYTKNIWRKFNLGNSGNEWEKAYILNLSLSYNEFLDNKGYLDFSLTRLVDLYTKALTNTWDLRIGFSPSGFDFYRIEWFLDKDFLIFPHSYLQVSSQIGYVSGNTSLDDKLNLSDWKSLMLGYYGNLKASLFLNWNMPLLKDQELKFLNLVILREVDFNVFSEFGGVWEDIESISWENLNLGLGLEFKYSFTTFFDIPFDLYFGYAFPIWQGTDSGEAGIIYSYINFDF